jgi:hypothetical protein
MEHSGDKATAKQTSHALVYIVTAGKLQDLRTQQSENANSFWIREIFEVRVFYACYWGFYVLLRR